jgi:hypothetical protein
MTKLNQKGVSRRATAPVAVSYNGNPQFAQTEAFALYDLVVSHFFGKDTFYESNDERLKRLETLVAGVVSTGNLHFIANTIVNARHVMNMRSMPLVLAVHFAKALRDQNKQYPHLREVIRDVIGRADQITDLYAVALGVFGSKNKIPLAIKRGVADAFNKFNEYQFAKYNSKAAVKLKDVLRIVHPKGSTEEQGALFKRIMTDTMAVADTWEAKLSQNGQLDEKEKKSKADLWGDMLAKGKGFGYMALLRNLRNMWEAPITDANKAIVYERLADPAEVKKSKQFPFRFVNAMTNVAQFGDSKLKRALSRAVDASLGNLPQLGNGVWIIIDCSGSMGGERFENASLFAAALAKANADAKNVAVTMFSDNAKHVTFNGDNPVLTIQEGFKKEIYGGGTNLQAALELKSKLGFEPDTVIVISDMQVNALSGSRYGSRVNVGSLFKSGTVKVAINVAGYANTPLTDLDGWYQLTGWSDRIFDFIPAMREKQSVVQTLSTRYEGIPKRVKTVEVEEVDEVEKEAE